MGSSVSDLFDRLGTPTRMRRLAAYDLFHPDLSAKLDDLASRTAQRLRAPVSLVSVVLDSSQYILGAHGVSGWVVEARGVPAEWSLCSNTVLAGAPFCIQDTATDPRFAENPLVLMAGLRSYAGVPLTDNTGQHLGAHCVIDDTPRTFTGDDLEVLTEGAVETMHILDRHRA
jgi:GAF domain-containing protein